MPQVSLYLDDDTHATMVDCAKEAGLSQSRWVAGLIRERADQSWPDFVRGLSGCWPDAPEPEELREASVPDLNRETL